MLRDQREEVEKLQRQVSLRTRSLTGVYRTEVEILEEVCQLGVECLWGDKLRSLRQVYQWVRDGVVGVPKSIAI